MTLLLLAAGLLAWYFWPQGETKASRPPEGFLRPEPPPAPPRPIAKATLLAERLAALDVLRPYLADQAQEAAIVARIHADG